MIVCDLQCPLQSIAKICGLTRLAQQSDRDYTDACNAVIREKRRISRSNKASAEDGAESTMDDDASTAGDEAEAPEASDVGAEGWL